MKRLPHLIFLMTISLLGCSSLGQQVHRSPPEAVVQDFYATYLRTRVSGLPSANELEVLGAYLSTDLAASLQKAQKRQEFFMKAHPDEKPPFVEGDLFSSLFEGPTSFEVLTGSVDGETARVRVRFSYAEPGKTQDTFTWEDAVLLKREGESWRIDDVEYLGVWDFASKGRLSENLKADL